MLHILNKHLANERLWLMRENLGAADRKYREGARMAKERIPQLEAAIKLIMQPKPPTTSNDKPTIKKKIHSQLSIFN